MQISSGRPLVLLGVFAAGVALAWIAGSLLRAPESEPAAARIAASGPLASLASSAPRVSAPPEPVSAPLPEVERASIRDALAAREYHAGPNERGLQAPNRRHDLRAYFGPEGVFVVERTDPQSPELVALSLAAIGRGEALAPVAPGEVSHAAARVEIARPGLVEWYENSPAGLEQGFTLDLRPEGVGELLLAIDVAAAEVSGTDERLSFRSLETGRTLRYDKLHVVDAHGAEQPARFVVADAGFAIAVDDSRAAYPLVVDPLLTGSIDGQIESNEDDAELGISVASAGDVDGDGYGDLIVGASLYDAGGTAEGAAFVFHGTASGIAASDPGDADTQLEADQNDARFGISVAGAGDVDGDGYDDVIVGASLYESFLLQNAEGAAFVFHGSAAGVVNSNPTHLDVNQSTAELGSDVAGAGDVNGDGYADVIVGAPFYTDGETDEGAAFVFHGSASGVETSIKATIQSNQASAALGSSVASAGDVDGDGYADVIVGAPFYTDGETDEGAALVFHGSASGITGSDPGDADANIQANQLGAQLGLVAPAGDVNGDGYADVIVGATSYDATVVDAGAAFLFHGSTEGITGTGPGSGDDGQLEIDQATGLHAVAGAGDVNGDGYADVIVSSREYSAGETNEGAAFVFLGSGTLGIGDGDPTSAYAQLEADEGDADFGASVASAGDVNGDGYADVIVGAPLYDAGGSDEGAAFLYLGGAEGVLDGNPLTAHAQIDSNQNIAALGYSVSSAGDVNGDGYDDVIVGAKDYDAGETDEGAAFVFLGSADGVLGTDPGSADARLESNQPDAEFGYSVASAGDVNGDGYADVIVGARLYNHASSVDEGAAFVFLGSADGIANGNPATAHSRLRVFQVDARFGASVNSAGDVNGDGFGDVIVGATHYDNGAVLDAGLALVYHGSPTGLVSNGSFQNADGGAFSSQSGSFVGNGVSSAGDVNGDGYADVIVGGNLYNAGFPAEGAAWVYLGSAAGIGGAFVYDAHAQLESDENGAQFGQSVSGAGDVNGDGYDDVIVGARNYDAADTDDGAAFVFLGSASGIADANPATAHAQLDGVQPLSGFGRTVSGAGDVNGDGYADVIVGANFFDAGEDDEGAAFVFLGSASGIADASTSTADAQLQSNQETATTAEFGWGVSSAGDVNGDGFADVIVGAYQYSSPGVEGAAFVFVGGGDGDGLPVQARHRNPTVGTGQPWGASGSPTSFDVEIQATHPAGRGRVKLEVEACDPGVEFGDPSCTHTFSPSWEDAAGAPLLLSASAPIPFGDLLKRYRARVLRAPYRVTEPGITPPPNPAHGPWRHLSGQAFDSKVRRQMYETVSIPVVGSSPSLLGGTANWGGIDTVVPAPTTVGDLSATFHPAAVDEKLEHLLPDAALIAFDLGADPLETWQLGYSGELAEDATLTFRYDDANLLVPEDDLRVWHHDNGRWVPVPVVAHDTVANTISVVSDEFSPFVIGGAGSSITGWQFGATAAGGTIEFTVGTVVLSVTTTAGQTPEQVADAIAAAINGNLTLSNAGIVATSAEGAVTMTPGPGLITSHSISDGGLTADPLGAIAIYSSPLDDGLPGPPVVVRGGHALVHVYFDAGFDGPPAGEDCSGAGIDEVCGWTVRFSASGNLVIVDIAWEELGAEHNLSPASPRPARVRSAAAGYGVSHVGPTKIATVALAGSEGDLRLTTQTTSEGFVMSNGTTKLKVPNTTLATTPILPWTNVSADLDSSSPSACGVLGNGELRCWGTGFQVGGEPAGPFKQVSTSVNAACALDHAGTVSCWGAGPPMPPSTTYLQLAGGGGHFCGLLPDLGVECWGGSVGAPPDPSAHFRMVSRGFGHACGLQIEGTVVCWGDDTDGQASPPVGTFTDLAGGTAHTCGLTPVGDVECWGDNTFLQAPAFQPGPYIDISAGADRTCGIKDDATLECWGDTSNNDGAILGTFQSLSLGDDTNCGIRSDGSAECWGGGAPSVPDVQYPLVVTGNGHTCQLRTDGSLECFGDNSFGQVTGMPVDTNFAVLEAGLDFTCTTQRTLDVHDRRADCWGDGNSGQSNVIGNGYGSDSLPLGIQGGYSQLSAGFGHACGLTWDSDPDCWGDITGTPTTTALLQIDSGGDFACGLRTSDRGIVCWGDDSFGQVSNAASGLGYISVSAGDYHACALQPNGALECWGGKGNGEANPPAGIYREVRAGAGSTCALRHDGTPLCWGDDGLGSESIPLDRTFSAITSGLAETATGPAPFCGASEGGGLICWAGFDGQGTPLPLESESVGDGIEDAADNCPLVDNGPLAGTCTGGLTLGVGCFDHADCGIGGYCSRFQEDSDFDGVGDACDNCVLTPNPQQLDREDPLTPGGPVGDGVGDACDPTPDGESADVLIVPQSVGAAVAGAGVAGAGGGGAYEVRLSCPDTVQIGRIQFGMVLPTEANAEFAGFAGVKGSEGPPIVLPTGCDEPGSGGCNGADPAKISDRVDLANSFIARGADVSGADPNMIFFSLLGIDSGQGRDLCDDEAVELLAIVEVDGVSGTQPATLSQNDSDKAASHTSGAYDDPPRPVEDDGGNEVQGSNWAYVAGDGEAPVKVLVSPAVEPNGGKDWVLKLESTDEMRRIKIGFKDATGGYELLGCPLPTTLDGDLTTADDDCCLGTCDGNDVCSVENPDLGPSVNSCLSRAEYDAVKSIVYIVLEGELLAESYLGDTTLVHTPNAPAPSRVTLGTLRIPPAEANVEPTFDLDGIQSVAPNSPAFVIPGSGETAYSNPVALAGSGEQSEDADGDLISNDTDNCTVFDNPEQTDIGGLHVVGQPAPTFDGVGDGCQCGDAMGDGQLSPPGFPDPGDPGDVRELQDVMAGVVSGPVGQAALARCSVSGQATGAGEPFECNAKDLLALALAIEGEGPGLSAVCSRNTPGQPLDP